MRQHPNDNKKLEKYTSISHNCSYLVETNELSFNCNMDTRWFDIQAAKIDI